MAHRLPRHAPAAPTSPGRVMTKWTKPAATASPNSMHTGRSPARSVSTMAMNPASKPALGDFFNSLLVVLRNRRLFRLARRSDRETLRLPQEAQDVATSGAGRGRRKGRLMILGLSTSTFTLVHVVLSLVGILSGLLVLIGMFGARRRPGWTALFLATTILTSVSGFFFPSANFGPSLVVGVISL